MKTILSLIVVLCLGIPSLGRAEAESNLTVSGPYGHENLEVFLLHGEAPLEGLPIMTLAEGLRSKKVVVHETGNVNKLTVENRSRSYVYLHSGDIVKGGKQDRTLPNSYLLAPMSKPVAVDSFCVEQGRWAKRGGESVAAFSSSEKLLPSKELKLAAKMEKSQSAVWDKVSSKRAKLSGKLDRNVSSRSSASSLQLALENKDVEKKVAEYVKAILPNTKGKTGVVGMAFTINGQFNSSDSFGSGELFAKLWPKLLESVATEAVGEFEEGMTWTSLTTDEVALRLLGPKDGSKKVETLPADRKLATKHGRRKVEFVCTAPVPEGEKSQKLVHRNLIALEKKGAVKPAAKLQQSVSRGSASAPPSTVPQKRGFFRRLFGR